MQSTGNITQTDKTEPQWNCEEEKRLDGVFFESVQRTAGDGGGFTSGSGGFAGSCVSGCPCSCGVVVTMVYSGGGDG